VDSTKAGWLPRPAPISRENCPSAWDIFKVAAPDSGMVQILIMLNVNIYITGEVSHVQQTPLTSSEHRQDWKCVAEYFSGDKKEFILPSPGVKLRLNTEQAMEGATNLRPQPFTGTYYALLAFFGLCILIFHL